MENKELEFSVDPVMRQGVGTWVSSVRMSDNS